MHLTLREETSVLEYLRGPLEIQITKNGLHFLWGTAHSRILYSNTNAYSNEIALLHHMAICHLDPQWSP